MKPDETIRFTLPQKQNDVIIKVIGVGGGGGNAVNHMYKQGIRDVSFLVCNTDRQALDNSAVPNRLQLGSEGLGAGNRPEVAAQAAEESLAEIDAQLEDGTKMVFITAGMGGGTGTGAAPIIARQAMKHDILTVGIVTIPFKFEGNTKIDKALEGLKRMQDNVDALLVINNQRLLELYQNSFVSEAFAIANDALTIAAKSIAEIITVNGIMNMDFNDVRTVLKQGGVAIMSTATAEGEGRISKAIENALNSPLLNNSDIYRSQKILMDVFYSETEGRKGLLVDEMNEIHEFMNKFDDDVETKFGLTIDPTLGDKVKIIILASGFGVDQVKKSVLDDEAEMEKAIRRGQFYGSKGDGSKRLFQIFKFRAVDLDNDDVIAEVTTLPTYNRQQVDINRIKAITRVDESATQSQTSGTASSAGAAAATIVF